MRFSRSVLLLMLVGLLATSCRFGEATPKPSATPTRPAAVTAVAPVGPASPTKTVPAQPVTAAPTMPAGPVAWTLTILHTGDVRGDVLPCGWGVPKGGLARRATAIARLRQQAAGPVLVLDSGNSLFALKATPTSDPSQGALPVAAMNAMRYDALALGERELAADLATVQQRFQEAAFAILSANVAPAGVLPKVQPYILRTMGGHTVAVIGLTNPAAAARAKALGLDLTIEDAAAALQRTLGELGGQAEVVIVLSNLDPPTNQALAQQIPGIDAIIGVNGGQPMDPTAMAGPDGQVVLHASYIQGEYLGFLTLGLDSAGHVVQFSGRALPLDTSYADDPDVAAMMRSYGVKP